MHGPDGPHLQRVKGSCGGAGCQQECHTYKILDAFHVAPGELKSYPFRGLLQDANLLSALRIRLTGTSTY